MRLTTVTLLLGCLVVPFDVSCSRSNTTATTDAATGQGDHPRYGAVMAEVGRRFELAGKAMAAQRYELAEFEIGELEELFEEDLPRADLPKEGNSAALPALAKSFLETHPPELKKAAAAKDRAAFIAAFQRAAATCNACHRASDHGFIEIPSALGKAVPDLDPIAPSP